MKREVKKKEGVERDRGKMRARGGMEKSLSERVREKG